MHDVSGAGKKLSIIIPALNEEKLISNLLDQFTDDLKKEFDLEVIVSDGGSNDSTIEIAKSKADKVVLHGEKFQQNISQGRNEGAKYSLGDVLIFLNADTIVSQPGITLQKLVREFEDEDLSAVAVRIEVIPEEAITSDKLFHGFYNFYVSLLNKFVLGMGRGECQVVRRKCFFEVKGYDEKLAAGEDFDLYRRLRRNGKVKFMNDIVVYESPRRYRKHGYSKVFWDWTKNSVSVLMTGKSISKTWDAVR